MPSGQYKHQVKVLCGHAEKFKQQILPSHLTPSEAYCCLMMYIRPKINYPNPCVSLTETQCHYIQAPILEAILPKLHLNRHTPRAVLFAGPKYGGLNIPENYTDLGYGHLQYLGGHIKLGADVGQLLLSLSTHTQLQVGSTTPFFQLQYPLYAKWIDSTWITDCWEFAHHAHITVDIESQWVPLLSRQGDIALMDMALTFNFDAYQLRCVNTCRLYLQVISVSDIVNARGDKLLPSTLSGEKDQHHVSSLMWPNIPRPSESFWTIWRIFLQHFTRGRKLMTSLGAWQCHPHKDWTWFSDSHQVVWEKIDASTWKRYPALASTCRQTRHSKGLIWTVSQLQLLPWPSYTLPQSSRNL
jgi:hypothetical protein